MRIKGIVNLMDGPTDSTLATKARALIAQQREGLEQEQRAAQAVQPEPVPLIAAFQALAELCNEDSRYVFGIHQAYMRDDDHRWVMVYVVKVCLKEDYARLVGNGEDLVLPTAIWKAIAQVKDGKA